jgi:hypothetical protein
MKELELRVSRAEFSAMMAARANSAKYTFGDLSDASIDTVVSAMFAALRGMATQRIATEHPIPHTTYKIVVVEPASILDEIERVKEPNAKPLARHLVSFVQRGLGMVSRVEIDHQGFAIAMMREFEGRFGWTLESEQPPRAVALREPGQEG